MLPLGGFQKETKPINKSQKIANFIKLQKYLFKSALLEIVEATHSRPVADKFYSNFEWFATT